MPRGDAEVSAFSPDGSYVVSADFGKTARVWETSTGKEIAQLPHDDVLMFLIFSPDGKYIASGSGDQTARVWEARQAKKSPACFTVMS
jgi:WD40 repeat protein